jgi:hypothetical protein
VDLAKSLAFGFCCLLVEYKYTITHTDRHTVHRHIVYLCNEFDVAFDLFSCLIFIFSFFLTWNNVLLNRKSCLFLFWIGLEISNILSLYLLFRCLLYCHIYLIDDQWLLFLVSILFSCWTLLSFLLSYSFINIIGIWILLFCYEMFVWWAGNMVFILYT